MPSRIAPQAVENRIGRTIGTLKVRSIALKDVGCKYGNLKHSAVAALEKLYVWLETRYILTKHEITSLNVRIGYVRRAFNTDDVITAIAMAISYLEQQQPIYVERQA